MTLDDKLMEHFMKILSHVEKVKVHPPGTSFGCDENGVPVKTDEYILDLQFKIDFAYKFKKTHARELALLHAIVSPYPFDTESLIQLYMTTKPRERVKFSEPIHRESLIPRIIAVVNLLH